MVKGNVAAMSLLLLGSALAGQGNGARADMKYTTESRMAGAAGAVPTQVITTAVRKNQKRVETLLNMGPVQRNTVMLTLCDKKQEITLDPELKIYMVAPLGGETDPPKSQATATPDRAATGAKSGTGRVISTASVEDLGEEMVADTKARHYRLTSHIQTSGCVGDSDITSKSEIWVADLREPSDCDLTSFDPAQAYSRVKPDCNVTFEQRGDKDAYAKVYNGLILRHKIFGEDGKPMMTQEVTSLSRAKLEDHALFSVPEGFRQVSADEFQKAQSEAMMKAMMSQSSRSQSDNTGGAGAGDENKAEPAETAKQETPSEKKEEEPQPKPKKPRFRLPRWP
jgi:hypothetical protein